MIKRLSYVDPVQCGKVLAVLYGCLSLFVVPFILLASMLGAANAQHANHGALAGGVGIVFAVLIPFFYALLGFVGGIIAAAVYNLVAGWTGGLQFTLVDVPSATPPAISYPPN